MKKFTLFGTPGWGSAIVEAQLVWYGLDYEFEQVADLFKSGRARAIVGEHNPLGQIPTLISPDGMVMTESAAITLWLADQTGSDDLVPGPAAPMRAAFLRWLIYLNSNVYPTYTYADDPSRFVIHEEARADFAKSVGQYRRRLYEILEGAAGTPWFLGDTFSAIDIYIATMVHWTPRRRWFEKRAPKFTAIADRTMGLPRFGDVWRRNFPEG